MSLDGAEGLREIANASEERFNKFGPPTRKEELWRYLSFSDLRLHSSSFEAASIGLTSDDQDVVFNTAEMLSEEQLLKLTYYIEKNAARQRDSLQSLADTFALKSRCLILPKNRQSQKPLKLEIVSHAERPSMLQFFIFAEEDSRSSLHIEIIGNPGFLNCHAIVVTEKNSELEVLVSNSLESNSQSYISFSAFQHLNSHWNYVQLTSSTSRVRTLLASELLEPYASCHMGGITLSQAKTSHDLHVDIKHSSGSTTSRQLFKAVVSDEGRSFFRGKIHIAQKAIKCEAYQSSKNLVLSERAEANSIPELHILCDDVKASHGSATGSMNPEELFYLESRGISRPEALQMLLHGYTLEVTELLKSLVLREVSIEKLSHETANFKLLEAGCSSQFFEIPKEGGPT